MNFTTKLLLLSLGSVLGVSLPLYLFLSYTGSQALEYEIKTRLHGQAVHTVDKLDRMLFERRADMQVLANILGNIAATVPPEQITQTLLTHRRHYKAYYSLSFYDAHRIRIADTAGFALGRRVEPNTWLATVFEQKLSSTGDEISFDNDLQKNIVYFAAPVQNEQNQLLGAVVARMPVENLYYVLGGLKDTTGQLETSLFNSSGKLLYSSNNSRSIGQPVLPAVTPKHIATHFARLFRFQRQSMDVNCTLSRSKSPSCRQATTTQCPVHWRGSHPVITDFYHISSASFGSPHPIAQRSHFKIKKRRFSDHRINPFQR